MNWLTSFLKSSLGRKVLMALTGLFLILFLTVHLMGNLQLLKSDGGESFNAYAHFMAENPLIKTVSIGNFAFILIHILVAIFLYGKNAKARGGTGYDISTKDSKSTWSSKNMTLLGTVILIFVVVHLVNFWAVAKFGTMPMTKLADGMEVPDLYASVSAAFKQEWLVALYVICMGFMAFHLSHGFNSAFITLGINNKKYTPIIQFIGQAFSIIVPLLYAIIPIYMYMTGDVEISHLNTIQP